VVTISVFLKWLGSTQSEALIKYVHTPLTEEREAYLKSEHKKVFEADLLYWETALNHYLATGGRLKR